MSQIKTAVIIITYNAMPWKEKCLVTLADVPENAIVYCIDNGSNDGTQAFIQNSLPSFKFYQSKENLGFGKANNLGFEMALKDQCTHFLLLNQDAQISWDDIFILAKLQNKNPDFGIISPLQLYNNIKVDFLHLKSLMKKSYDYFNDLICNNELKTLFEIHYTNAAIWLLSKDCLEKVGGFDPIFPHYGEDNDYSNRVNYFGLKVGLAPHQIAYHLRDQSIKTNLKSKKEHYINFLVRVKKLDFKTNKSYLKIFFELLSGSLNSGSDFGNIQSWNAFLKLIKNYRLIKKHKQLNLSKSYCFLYIS